MTTAPPTILKLLADDVRWKLVTALMQSDYRVHELVNLIAKPMNLVSYHLRQLRDAQLIREQRSAADRRDVYYSLDLDHLAEQYSQASTALHPALAPHDADDPPLAQPVRILFLCTHNSARSQMAEAVMRHMAGSMVEVMSAGTQPSQIHPQTLAVLQDHGITTEGLHAKHLDQFVDQHFDYIITVCDRAREQCPLFRNDPEQIHWSFADPAAVAEDQQRHAFEQTLLQLQTRIRYLLTLIRKRGSA